MLVMYDVMKRCIYAHMITVAELPDSLTFFAYFALSQMRGYEKIANELHRPRKKLQEAHVVIQASDGKLDMAEIDMKMKIARDEASGSLDKLASAEAGLQALAGELEKSKRIVVQQQIALDEAIAKCRETERVRDEARSRLEVLSLQQNRAAGLERKLTESEAKKAVLAASLSEARAGLDKAQAKATQLEDAMSSKIRGLGLKVAEKDEEMRHMRARLLEAEEGLRRSSRDACNCKRELSRSRDECESLKSKLSSLLAEMDITVTVDVTPTKGKLVEQNQDSLEVADKLENASSSSAGISVNSDDAAGISVNADDGLTLAVSELGKTKMRLEESSGQLEETRLALSQAQAYSEWLEQELETVSSRARRLESAEVGQTPRGNRDVWGCFSTPDGKSTHRQHDGRQQTESPLAVFRFSCKGAE